MSAQPAMKIYNAVQEIKSARGEKMYLLSEQEYLRLKTIAEDKGDIKDVTQFLRQLEAGEEELVPAKIANLLIEGANPVKVWREYRALSAKALAEAAGVSASYLSQIESGAKKGTVELYRKLAQILRLSIEDLI